MSTQLAVINVSSAELLTGGLIPAKYTSQNQNIHPPITFRGLPLETASIAMILEKVEKSNEVFDHWIIWNMTPTPAIAEGSATGVIGKNSSGENKYVGPCVPFGDYYRLQVYALNQMLTLNEDNGKHELKHAMEGHILAMGSMHAYCNAQSFSENLEF